MAGALAREGGSGLTPAAARLPILYGITDPRGARGLTAPAAARLLFAAGVTLVQARLKDGPSRDALAAVREVVAEARARGALAIVNDRSDLAILACANGVHLGEEDLSAHEGRRLLGEAALIGVSTHDPEALRRAMEDPDASYVALGPIFPTATKQTPRAPLGLAGIEAAARMKTLPLVVIGGIRPDDVGACLTVGADSVAMIGGLLDGDPGENVRRARASAERAGFHA